MLILFFYSILDNLHNLMHKHDTLMQMPLGGVFVHACKKQRIRRWRNTKKADHI